MSVKPVKAISIIGMMSELDKVIKFCGDSQMFHPDDAMSFYSNTQNFVPLDEKNPYATPLQSLRSAADMAGFELEYVKLKNFSVSSKGILKYVKFLVNKLEKMVNDRLRCRQDIDACRRKIEQVGHFVGRDLDFTEIMKCRYINPTFGRLPNESFQKLSEFSDNPYVLFFSFTEDETHHWGAYFAPNEQKDEIDRIFSSLYFEKLEIPPIAGTPEQYVKTLEKELERLKEEQEKTENTIDVFWKAEREKCMMYYSKLQELNSYHAIKRYVYKYHKSFILVGWIPAENEEFFTRQLDGIKSIEYSLSDGKDELKHSPPVILKNAPFMRLYEFYVKMYGLPCYNEVDPTPIVAITYTLFFGIMFGDMGQGLVVAIVGALMWKLKKMELGRILIPCGISGMVFGFIYGSVFGFEEALNPVYKALFGIDGKLVEVMEPETINFIIYGSVAMGFVTLAVTMLVNIYSSLRRKDPESAFFGANGVAGFVFYVSLVAGLVCTMFLNIPVMNAAYVICLIAVPLVLMFLREPLGRLAEGRKNWQPEKWGEYCMQSFFELFEMCLSYVTNTMSFLRVGAYILVHAGMMLVVFTLAEMVGGVVGYTLVVIIGNGIVMALEALLVAIQVLRLDYYEIFSRFYIGEGRQFTPVTARKDEE
ncbi:MAG: ATPase [Clostridia bacterium]|nr:ATPase [Clostridia bacterium]